MRIALYSEAGRRHIARGHELISAEGFASTPDGIRRCRAAIAGRNDDPSLAKITEETDFYTLSGCRDLLFHVQEHRFTLPAIQTMLDSLNLAFMGFELTDPAIKARYRKRFPDDHSLSSLANWDQFELENPETFRRMYHLWVRRR